MIDLVIPTIGRASLRALFTSLAASTGPLPDNVYVVDDRRERGTALAAAFGALPGALRVRTHVLPGRAAGPAAARNIGWRASSARWIAFLDDDVVVSSTWLLDLAADIAACGPRVAGTQGRISVPLRTDRRPTDWERNVAGLEAARWITADCAYRRADLLAVGGFDERFRRAFREDSDLGLRITERGGRIVEGSRRTIHPVREAGWAVSIGLQAGNADDVLMDALHGADWHERAGAPRGLFARHAATAAFGAMAVAGAAGWFALTLDFARRRIAPGPQTPAEVSSMLVTSAVVPFAAVAHRIAGYARLRATLANRRAAPHPLPRAVLFDRDGTLVHDVPYNGDPQAVEPFADARTSLQRLREAGIATGIVSNQSGVALGKLTPSDVAAVNARVDQLLGPFDTIQVCTHAGEENCACRKPAPGLIVAAARELGIAPRDCVIIGDIGSDIDAARAAGARAILVPTPITRAAEIVAAPEVARSLADAIDRILEPRL